MRNFHRKYCVIIIITVTLSIFCFGNASDSDDSIEIYTGLRNKFLIDARLHETLCGVWRFGIDTEHLIISGLKWNDYPGRRQYFEKDWENKFEINDIEKILSALNKAMSWAEISRENKIKKYQKVLTNLGQGISIYFNVSETGESSVIFRNDQWEFFEQKMSGRPYIKFIELCLNYDDLDDGQDTILDVLKLFKNYKEMHQKYVEEQAQNRELQLQQLDNEKREKERLDQLFQ